MRPDLGTGVVGVEGALGGDSLSRDACVRRSVISATVTVEAGGQGGKDEPSLGMDGEETLEGVLGSEMSMFVFGYSTPELNMRCFASKEAYCKMPDE